MYKCNQISSDKWSRISFYSSYFNLFFSESKIGWRGLWKCSSSFWYWHSWGCCFKPSFFDANTFLDGWVIGREKWLPRFSPRFLGRVNIKLRFWLPELGGWTVGLDWTALLATLMLVPLKIFLLEYFDLYDKKE